jgi:hypothetical protein
MKLGESAVSEGGGGSGCQCVMDSGLIGSTVGRVPREQNMLMGHLPRAIYISRYTSMRREIGNLLPNNRRQRRTCYALCHIRVRQALDRTCPLAIMLPRLAGEQTWSRRAFSRLDAARLPAARPPLPCSQKLVLPRAAGSPASINPPRHGSLAP